MKVWDLLDIIAMAVAGLVALLVSLAMIGVAYWKVTNGHFLSAIASFALAVFLGWLAFAATKSFMGTVTPIEEEITEL